MRILATISLSASLMIAAPVLAGFEPMPNLKINLTPERDDRIENRSGRDMALRAQRRERATGALLLDLRLTQLLRPRSILNQGPSKAGGP